MEQHTDSAQQAPNSGIATLDWARSSVKRAFLSVALFSVGVNLLMLTVPIYMMQTFDRVLSTHNVDTLIMLSIMAAVALITMAMLDGVRGFVAARASMWLDRVLGPPLLESSVYLSLRSGHRGSAQPLRDLSAMRNFLGGRGIFPLFDAPWAPIFLFVTYLMHPLLAIVAGGGMAVILAIAIANEALTRTLIRSAAETQGRVLNDADATVRNADTIAAMGMLPAVTRRWADAGGEGLESQDTASQRSIVMLSSARLVRLVLQMSVLATGAYLVINSEITPGTMIAASILMNRAVAPIEQAIGSWRSSLAAWFAYGRLRKLLETGGARQSNTRMPAPEGRLKVEKLSWTPLEQREPILRDVSFELEPGDALGVVGPSAAGKTTLIRLIVGSLSPSEGSVQLDGAEVSVWNSVDRGQYVGYLPQDVELFDGTVKENIARFSESSDEAVVDAARLAGAHEMILELPLGYDTVIGGHGMPLSGGQRQKVGLARALLGRPRFVVLDEPNAHLDTPGEQALVAALRELKRSGSTVVMVVQRFAGLREMDKLLSLRSGTVTDFGKRDHVLADIGRRIRGNEPERAAPAANMERA